MDKWPRATQGPLITAQYRAQPEHFVVDELTSIKPAGQGQYLLLQIRKRDINTAAVASELAKYFKIKPFDVSYAGRKDKFAVTSQWFCIKDEFEKFSMPTNPLHNKFTIIATTRHEEKLGIGDLVGNDFQVRLTDIQGDTSALNDKLAFLISVGFPNYFGSQRFGSKNQNLIRGRRMLAGELRVRDKNQRSLYLSACRSFLFNEILASRVKDNSWTTCIAGDVPVLQSSDVLTSWSASETLLQSPVGYLPGDGEIPVNSDSADMIRLVLQQHKDLYKGIKNARVKWHSRPLLMRPNNLTHQWEADELVLKFSLPKGSFATSLLRELLEE